MAEENNKPQEGAEENVGASEQETVRIDIVGADASEGKNAEELQAPEGYSIFGEAPSDLPSEKPQSKSKSPKRISLTAFICTCVALVVAAVMLTYTVCNSAYQVKLAEVRAENGVQGSESNSGYTTLDILQQIFETYSFEELDEDTIRNEILKAYVRATGDEYAEYYTLEEYAELQKQMAGESQGIGISIINSTVDIGGVEYKTLKIINVMKNSPAEKAGMLIGDCIIAVGTAKDNLTVSKLNYDKALAELRGVAGTTAYFGYYRPSTGVTDFIEILREEFTQASVMYDKVDDDVSANTALIKILSFDSTTPDQLTEAVEKGKNEGCDKFVFDLRYNPGGQLDSIAEILSYFLKEGDTIISMKDKNGNGETITASASSGYVAAEDIGKYADLNMVVLCNESTASAAELFVANFRDHGLGMIVGTTTFGKGTVQTYISSINIGGQKVSLGGVLKLTVYMYYPPNGVSYDGIGIEPSEGCKVEVSEEAASKNIYDIMGTAEDNQLVEAVNHFKQSN